tara:strand:- start:1487 stop:2518 length:1032 start_codon:yes stop_codon:yes gene_type:complete
MKIIKNLLYMSILIGLFVEFLSIIAVKNNLLIFNNSPPYAIHKKNKGEQWRLFDKEIGPWHKPMSKDRHIRRCFDVNYQSNNIGARDNMDYDKVYFNKSTILLGDSFAEGFGVNLEETFAKIIEKSTNKKIINLGVAGSNTSNNLKRFIKFTKNKNYAEIIYFLLPENDFIDDKIDLELNEGLKKKDKILKENYKKNFKEIMILYGSSYFYSYNLLRTIKFFIYEGSDYYHDNSFHYKNKKAINKILDNVFEVLSIEEKEKTLIIIPSRGDMTYQKNNTEKNYKQLYWYNEIYKRSKNNNVKLIDLMDFANLDIQYKYFLDCDPHWNKYGNEFAAKIYLENIK